MDAKTTTAGSDVAAVRRRRRWPWLAAVVVLLLLLGAGVWLGLGLLGAARDARAAATRARADLQGSASALSAGDEAGARRGIRAANLDLARADAAARRIQVRVAARLPVVSSPVADLRHLLAAGHILAGTAEQAVTVQARFTDTGILRGGRIDLAVVGATLRDTTAMLGQLERARGELGRVRGGWLAPGAAAARDASLRQLDEVEGQLRPINDVVRALPPAIGGAGPRTYLVAISNSAELKAWGGAPLAIALLRFDRGQVRVLRRGALSEQQLTGRITWPYVPGDPWHAPGSSSLFSSSGLSPNFPTSGEEILRAFQKITRVRADGVFTVNSNASKTDYFQRRQIEQRVRLAADGSARVDRAVRLDNTARAEPGGDPRTGYTTGWARPVVADYLPGAATGVSVRVDGKPADWSSFKELGRLVVRTRLWLPPRSTHTVTVSYRLARAAVPTGGGLRYQLVVDPQPIAHPAKLRVVVVPPSGFDAGAQPGWASANGGLVASRELTGGATFNLDVRR